MYLKNPGARGRFKPGVSGNPGGRPKAMAEVRDHARKYTREAIETLVEAMRRGETHSARITAAQVLLDRGWGKAPQAVTGEDGTGPVTITLVWGDSAE